MTIFSALENSKAFQSEHSYPAIIRSMSIRGRSVTGHQAGATRQLSATRKDHIELVRFLWPQYPATHPSTNLKFCRRRWFIVGMTTKASRASIVLATLASSVLTPCGPGVGGLLSVSIEEGSGRPTIPQQDMGHVRLSVRSKEPRRSQEPNH